MSFFNLHAFQKKWTTIYLLLYCTYISGRFAQKSAIKQRNERFILKNHVHRIKFGSICMVHKRDTSVVTSTMSDIIIFEVLTRTPKDMP